MQLHGVIALIIAIVATAQKPKRPDGVEDHTDISQIWALHNTPGVAILTNYVSTIKGAGTCALLQSIHVGCF